MRRVFFGPLGDTLWNLERLKSATRQFTPVPLDIRDREGVMTLFRENRFDLIIHCAAQPSHDKAADIAILDFEVNALGTVNLLEAARQHCRDAAFIFMSTNKVYGDAPNEKPLRESETRYDYSDPADYEGIDETCRIDRTMHSLFGASKVAADIYAQEYGRYFGMGVGIFRGGCLTGPSHSGVELHGFLSYLLKVALSGKPYTVFGYKGKQVRDNIHSFDVVRAFEEFARNPRFGEVYNLGGGRRRSIASPCWKPSARIRSADRPQDQLDVLGTGAKGRSHLLYLKLGETEKPLPWLEPDSESRFDPGRDGDCRAGAHPERLGGPTEMENAYQFCHA